MKTLLFALASGPDRPRPAYPWALHPCHLPGVPDEVRCGTLDIFENRDARSGRRIALAVAVLPALGPDRLPDPVAQVRACRDELVKRADLSQYTTPRIADDMAEVAAALGYGKLNVMGTSYGTRAALVFLRRHPDLVRTATGSQHAERARCPVRRLRRAAGLRRLVS